MNFKLFLQQNSNNLADCLAENKFLLKLAYLCDIFAKLNKLNISMQGPDKNMLDVSDKIAAFIKCLCGRKMKKACLEVLSTLLYCQVCRKRKVRCFLQI